MTPTRALAQTYLDRFEAGTPRAPTAVPETAPPAVQRQDITDVQRLLAEPESYLRNIRLVMARQRETERRQPSFLERLAQGPAQVAAAYQGLGVNLAQQFPGSVFGRKPVAKAQTATIPTIGSVGSRISHRGGPEQLGARRLFTTVSALYRGVRPPMIGFDAQEFLGLTDEEIGGGPNQEGLGYTKVAGGWVRRELWDQPLNNVYGSGTAAQPQTINVNYGGYGGGGGGTRQQSSYLVNWRI